MLDEVRRIVQSHLSEAQQGIVDKSPSALARGEGTQRNFSILKIDLVESTSILAGRRPETYLKLAHAFLSSVDKIARHFGADGEQVEYQGDSIIAYFPESVPAEDVLSAACLCRAAVKTLMTLDRTMGTLSFRCKIVVDFAPLIVAKIGPRASSSITAIGYPLHLIAKMEKTIGPDTGRVTPAFRARVPRNLWMYLRAARKATDIIPVAPSVAASSKIDPNPNAAMLALLLGARSAPISPQNSLASMLNPSLRIPPIPPAPALPLGDIIGYDISWDVMCRQLGID